MQQDNNHIENNLRQLENKQLPDLSQMDAHWQQLKADLQPPLPKAKPAIAKGIWWMIGAAAVVGSVLLIILQNSKTKEDIVTTENKIVKAEKKIMADTISSFAAVITNTPQHNAIPIVKPSSVARKIIAVIKEDTAIAVTAGSIVTKDTLEKKSTLSVAEKQLMLNNLLVNLQKKQEQFTIDNTKDTTVKCKEGSVLFIPANAFNTKDSVVFEVKEFYKYGDMVANGLTTMSDNKQLVTGGMLYLSAKVKGKDVQVNPEKEIRVFIPGLSVKDSMEIFEGITNKGVDTVATAFAKQSKINWQLTKVRIDSPVLKMFIRAIDLKDDMIEYSVYNGKTKAVFHRSRQSIYSKEELKVILQKKYGGYYDKIRVRKQWDRNLLFKKIDTEEEEYYHVAYNSYGVGDTAELLPLTIKINKLDPIDTVYKVVRWVNKGFKEVRRPNFPANTLMSIGEKYSIGINKLGWINCDRFFSYPGKKAAFTVDLKDSSFNYMTFVVFENFKSIMQAGETGNYAIFDNVPVGEPVKIISVGIRDGQTVSAIRSTVITEGIYKDLSFETTSASDFKYALSKIEK
ncbi:hypothetical protein [Ferruginibacter sp. SUN106]|uniref:hypothetical protein n=1 Tax=Ferruginibacter sp. SUN106 TaxID=2978348 RepID=UPI003D36C544